MSVLNEDNLEYGTEGGNDTLDKIYLLSVSEVSNASYGFLPYKDENNVVIYDKARERTDTAYVAAGSNSGLNGYVDSWWLRSPFLHSYEAAVVYGNGNVGGIIVSASEYTVCPALHLNLLSTDVWSNAETVTVYR